MINETENIKIFFTILPSKAGFTDQLLQFSTYYKLGLSLGYIYAHSEFTNSRHGAEDIYSFLGFNEHFSHNKLTSKEKAYRLMGVNNCFSKDNKTWHRKIRERITFWLVHKLFFKVFNFVDIGLGETVPLEEGTEPLEGLRNLIRKVVARNYTADPKRKNVVRFYLTSGGYFFKVLTPLLNQKTPFFPDKLDLRSTCVQQRKTPSKQLQHIDEKLKLLIHVRLGDTALIKTPWHSYIPLWAWYCISHLKEYPDKNDPIFRKIMDVEDFAHFLRKLFILLNANEFSTVVFSDGYKTAFKDLFRKLDDLNLNDEKVRALKESALTYEQQQFSIFDDIENCVCRVGETNIDLQELIHSALTADIIVVGCHQRMIPKFLSTYYDSSLESPPIIIALHNGIEPRYGIEIGLDEKKAKVYPVNVNNLYSDNELIPLVEEIKRHHTTDRG